MLGHLRVYQMPDGLKFPGLLMSYAVEARNLNYSFQLRRTALKKMVRGDIQYKKHKSDQFIAAYYTIPDDIEEYIQRFIF